jgi:hypothetical protein
MIRKKTKTTGLDVKDSETHKLARAIGETRRGNASVKDLRAIGKRASAHVERPYLDHAELLYDERGLPT